MKKLITNELAEVVFGSNQFEHLGVDLDEILQLCLFVFSGEGVLENVDRYIYLCGCVTFFDGIPEDGLEARKLEKARCISSSDL